jgi:hypothetical protein
VEVGSGLIPEAMLRDLASLESLKSRAAPSSSRIALDVARTVRDTRSGRIPFWPHTLSRGIFSEPSRRLAAWPPRQAARRRRLGTERPAFEARGSRVGPRRAAEQSVSLVHCLLAADHDLTRGPVETVKEHLRTPLSSGGVKTSLRVRSLIERSVARRHSRRRSDAERVAGGPWRTIRVARSESTVGGRHHLYAKWFSRVGPCSSADALTGISVARAPELTRTGGPSRSEAGGRCLARLD